MAILFKHFSEDGFSSVTNCQKKVSNTDTSKNMNLKLKIKTNPF